MWEKWDPMETPIEVARAFVSLLDEMQASHTYDRERLDRLEVLHARLRPA